MPLLVQTSSASCVAEGTHMSQLDHLDAIAREAWAGNYERVEVLSTGERLYVALASGRMRELEWMAHMLQVWRSSTQPKI